MSLATFTHLIIADEVMMGWNNIKNVYSLHLKFDKLVPRYVRLVSIPVLVSIVNNVNIQALQVFDTIGKLIL
jgi:hypothetical protein